MRIGILGIVMASAPWHDHASATVPWENRYGQSGMAVIAKEASGDCWKDVVAIAMMPLPKQYLASLHHRSIIPKNAQKKSKKKSRFFHHFRSQYRQILRHCTLRGPLHGSRLISSSPQISQVLLIFLPWYLWVLSIYLSIIILLFNR